MPGSEPVRSISAIPPIPWTNQKRSSILKHNAPVFLMTAPDISTWYLSDNDLLTNNVAYPSKTVILVKTHIDYIIDFNLSPEICFVVKNESKQSILFAKSADTFWRLGPNTMHLMKSGSMGSGSSGSSGSWEASKMPDNLSLEQAANYAELAMQI